MGENSAWGRTTNAVAGRSAAENEAQKEPRICLKLHYQVAPKALSFQGDLVAKLTSAYNDKARKLFLATIDSKSLSERLGAWIVVVTTFLFCQFEKKLGWANVLYLTTVATTALWFKSYLLFLVCTSFAHYMCYISTYHARADKDGIAFGLFKRDAVLYKTFALAQAGGMFLSRVFAGEGGFARADVALALALMVCGFGLSTLATAALGVDRTYFGWEVGAIRGEFVQKFPYGTIPHPMILGSMLAWLGFHMLSDFRDDFPYLVPCHLALYLVHAIQEHRAIHTTGELERSGDNSLQKKTK